MIQTIDLRADRPTRAEMALLVPRSRSDVTAVASVAAELIEEVRAGGELALFDQAERLDRVRPSRIRIHIDDINKAVRGLPKDVRAALDEAIVRLTRASQAQLPAPTATLFGDGAEVIQRWKPVARVGLYVPGGKAVYPSSVLMNVIPAQVAGVASIAVASPAQAEYDGGVHPIILGAAGLLGIEEVYAMGGAGAIGALAYGVPSIGLDPVQIITGPGNVYVAAAKRLVRGVVGIDSEAGPTEILVIADSTADADLVAADLVSQAEHDELAAAVLVTDSVEFAAAVRAAVSARAKATLHSARVTEALNGVQSAVVLVADLEQAAEFSNAYGPEHLEIQTIEPGLVLDQIDNAGAIFLGPYSPVSLGDYLAGSNHVLPTGGQSRFSSALGAFTFVRPQQIISYNKTALKAVESKILALSSAEDLPAHGEAISARFEAP
jgi:histidinol dehydrogenase